MTIDIETQPDLKSIFGVLPPVTVTVEEHLDGDNRYYTTSDGKKYLSVTSMLKHFKSEYLKRWCENPDNQKKMQRASSVGSKVHSMTESLLRKRSDPSFKHKDEDTWCFFTKQLVSQVKPYLDQIVPYMMETGLWSDTMKLAGRTDCVGLYKGIPSIIDFKNSLRTKKEDWILDYFIQATCYAIMWEELTGVPINQIVILITTHDGEVQEFVRNTRDYLNILHHRLIIAQKKGLLD